jgi:hypothetical protein
MSSRRQSDPLTTCSAPEDEDGMPAGSRAFLSENGIVDTEQRRRMAECCAFFNAERFRVAGPGRIRASDVRAAEAEIDALLNEPPAPGAAPRAT